MEDFFPNCDGFYRRSFLFSSWPLTFDNYEGSGDWLAASAIFLRYSLSFGSCPYLIFGSPIRSASSLGSIKGNCIPFGGGFLGKASDGRLFPLPGARVPRVVSCAPLPKEPYLTSFGGWSKFTAHPCSPLLAALSLWPCAGTRNVCRNHLFTIVIAKLLYSERTYHCDVLVDELWPSSACK